MREYKPLTSDADRSCLSVLADPNSPPLQYQDALWHLGQSLADGIIALLGTELPKQICVVCTVEDADSLGVGIIERLEATGLGQRVRVVCFWNDRIELPGMSLAPILKEYREPCDLNDSALIVVKSIISSACVVRTNLADLIAKGNPKRILVVAPVMFKGADESLKREFAPQVSSRFEYLTLAVDDEKNGKFVVPGVGGDIYVRLGYGGMSQKNRHMPQLVKTRRKRTSLAA